MKQNIKEPDESYRKVVVEFFNKKGIWELTARYTLRKDKTLIFKPSEDKLKNVVIDLLKKDRTNYKSAWSHAVVKLGDRGALVTRREFDEIS